MHQNPTKVPMDYIPFDPVINTRETRYGLPEDIKHCKTCVITNQRPNSAVEFKHNAKSEKSTINFDENCVCDACRSVENKHKNIDWDARDKELRELCDKFRSKDGSYDCVAPGSGGKDSVYAAHILKAKYDMHPLTVTWAPHLFTDVGWRNFQAWIHSGFDNILHTPNGRVHRLLTRLATENLFHPFQPFIIGQKNIAPKIAELYNIPLVFYGENEAEYGNPIQDNNSARRAWGFFAGSDDSEIYLSGVNVKDLKEKYGLNSGDLEPYMPTDPGKLKAANVEVHYLGYYLKWHPQECYYYAVEHCGFEAAPERTPGTYSKYNSIDDKIDDLHYYATLIKFGIGRATYDASQEIRSGEIDREEGVALIKKFDQEFPERYIDEILKYLSLPLEDFPEAAKNFEQPIMDRAYFDSLADQFRSPHIWKREGDSWQLRSPIWTPKI
jgi:N-acetyl sugar amidotransferase